MPLIHRGQRALAAFVLSLVLAVAAGAVSIAFGLGVHPVPVPAAMPKQTLQRSAVEVPCSGASAAARQAGSVHVAPVAA